MMTGNDYFTCDEYYADIASVRAVLASVCTEEEADVWMRTRQRSLDGCRPADLIARGKTADVIAVASRRRRRTP